MRSDNLKNNEIHGFGVSREIAPMGGLHLDRCTRSWVRSLAAEIRPRAGNMNRKSLC